MSKGIFAVMEDLDSEVINGLDTLDVDDITDHHEEIRDMHDDIQDDLDSVSDAINAKDTLEEVTNRLPEDITGENGLPEENIEAIMLSTEHICNMLGTSIKPSIESYSNYSKTRALKVSLEGKLGDIGAAIKQMLIKIRDKIVAFFKAIMAFIKKNTVGRLKKEIKELKEEHVVNTDKTAGFKNREVYKVFGDNGSKAPDVKEIEKKAEKYLDSFKKLIFAYDKYASGNIQPMEYETLDAHTELVKREMLKDHVGDLKEIPYANNLDELDRLVEIYDEIIRLIPPLLNKRTDFVNSQISHIENSDEDKEKIKNEVKMTKDMLGVVNVAYNNVSKALLIYIKRNLAYFRELAKKEGK